jgi:hypothetical protein
MPLKLRDKFPENGFYAGAHNIQHLEYSSGTGASGID